jgi:hypothetical protein
LRLASYSSGGGSLSEAIANGVVGDGFAARLAASAPGLAMGGDRPIEIRLPNGIVIGKRVLTATALFA